MKLEDKTSIYDQLRIQIVELKRDNDALKADNEVLKRALSEEVAEKYRAYEKLARLS